MNSRNKRDEERGTRDERSRRSPPGGFTLIEVLVVVAIIALLIAILLPSLARAREQAHIAKCLANMSNLPKAVLTFAQDHKGFGQLLGQYNRFGGAYESKPHVGSDPTWGNVDSDHSRYDYQMGYFARTGTWLKPWPIAYAKELGNVTLKRAENYFEQSTTATIANIANPSYFLGKFGRNEVLICPSDKQLVHNAWTPYDNGSTNTHPFGVFSYAVNEDVFGVTAPSDKWGCWKDGSPQKPGAADRLKGKIDKIIRPSQVAFFCDGGNEDRPQLAPQFFTFPDPGNSPTAIHGPYLQNTQFNQYTTPGGGSQRIPQFRHSADGGVAVAMADGSGIYAKPVEWFIDTGTGTKLVKRYSTQIRVSPYQVGTIDPNLPQP